MAAVAELLGPDSASRLAELAAELRQREHQAAADLRNATPRVMRHGQDSEPPAAPVCDACGQRIPAPAAVFRVAMEPASLPAGHGER